MTSTPGEPEPMASGTPGDPAQGYRRPRHGRSPSAAAGAAGAGAGAGALVGAVFTLLVAWWVENDASVGWASLNTDGIEASGGTKAFFIVAGGLLAAAVGALVGSIAGLLVAGLGPRRLLAEGRGGRLVVRLVATWLVASIPLLHEGAGSDHSYRSEIPGWVLLAGVVGSAVWLVVWAAHAAGSGTARARRATDP